MLANAENRTKRWEFVLDEPTRILVVDDDPILREFASVYLATPCTVIDTACDGVAARIRLDQNSYDVLLLDIEMPHLDGFSLLAGIRSDNRLRRLPVIMLTGHDDVASIDRAYQAGANSFATKPVNWRQLSYQIRYVIRGIRLEANVPEMGAAGSAICDVASATDSVRKFLRSVACQAGAIEERLPIADRAHYASALQGVRLSARQALAVLSHESRSAADGSSCADAATARAARPDYRNPST